MKIRDFVDLGFYRVWVCVQMQRRRVRDNEASRIPNRVGSLSLIGFSFFFLMIHVSINGVKSDILMIHCSLLICSSSRFLRQSASQALSHSCSESALRLPQQSTAQCSPAVHFRYKYLGFGHFDFTCNKIENLRSGPGFGPSSFFFFSFYYFYFYFYKA